MSIWKAVIFVCAIFGALGILLFILFVLAVAAIRVNDARREGRELKRQQEQVAARERQLDALIAEKCANLDAELVRELFSRETGDDQ